MRHRLSMWWHRKSTGHTLGPQVPVGTIELPWLDFQEIVPTSTLWASRCLEEGCFRVWVEVDFQKNEGET